MERARTYPSTPRNVPVSTAIYFCSICDKPFTNEISRDRHFRYCGRHTRNRPRSCRACNAAKTKCNFEVPCSRCTMRNIECLYNKSTAAARQTLHVSATAAHPARVERSRGPSTSLGLGPSRTDEGAFPLREFIFADDLALSEAQPHPINGDELQYVATVSQNSPDAEGLNFDDLFAFEDDISRQQQRSKDVSLAFHHDLDQQSTSWCLWMRSNVSLAVVAEESSVTFSNLLALESVQPHAQHNADIIIQSLRAFPTMMLRRETFPSFIHPQSQLLSNSARAALPEALSNCMSIAQMFVSRTSETKYFLRQTIAAEHRRFRSEMHNMSKFDLLAAMQACMIYIVIFIIDYSAGDEESARELLLALNEIYLLFKEVSDVCSAMGETVKADSCWEDWIFDESQRRYTLLWLLVGCVVCIKNGNVWDPSQSYRTLQLPHSKYLWEAPSQAAWKSEYEAYRCSQSSGLATLGDLVDAQQASYMPSNARKLDKWNAGTDNLGCLLNLVGTME